jgi:hypothetical protein
MALEYSTRRERIGIRMGFWWEMMKERDYYEDVDIVGRTISKRILEK